MIYGPPVFVSEIYDGGILTFGTKIHPFEFLYYYGVILVLLIDLDIRLK